MTPAPLTETDIEAAFRLMVPVWFLERLDTQLGTAGVVAVLKARGEFRSSCGPCDDGPYSDGQNKEWWARHVWRCKQGAEVTVLHEIRDGESTVLRHGFVPWNNLANRATIAALQLRRETAGPRAGEQIPLFA